MGRLLEQAGQCGIAKRTQSLSVENCVLGVRVTPQDKFELALQG